MTMHKGIVYACSDPQWAKETIVSAFSARRHMPNVELEFYATVDVIETLTKDQQKIFSRLEVIDRPSFMNRPRFEAMERTELDAAIVIDGDTLFLENVEELFDITLNFHLAAIVAPYTTHPHVEKAGLAKKLPSAPASLPEMNAGVLVCRKSEELDEFVKEWLRLFTICKDNKYHMDQAGFRVALANSEVRFAPLSNVYNFRANIPHIIRERIRILHAHGDLKELAKTINLGALPKFYQPDARIIYGHKPKQYDPSIAKKNQPGVR